MIIFSIQSPELVRAMKIREKASRAGLVSWLLSQVGGLMCVESTMSWVCEKLHLPVDCFLTTGFRTVSIGNKDQRPNQKDCV